VRFTFAYKSEQIGKVSLARLEPPQVLEMIMKHALICLAVLLPLAALAEIPSPSQERGSFRQNMFEQRKAAEMASHQERIRILQVADGCVRNASTPEAFRMCEDAERTSRQAFQDQERAGKEQLRMQLSQFREQGQRPTGTPPK
jgi:hypothetical protein